MLGIGVKILPIPLTSLRGTQALPSGGLVTRAPESLRINKRLECQNRVAKMLLPILGQPITNQLQNARGQIGPATRRGQHQKALVLRDQMTPLGNLASGPMQPAISRFDVKSRRTEHQQRQPLTLILRDVAERLADDSCVLKIMFTRQQFIEPGLFRRLDQTHADLPQQHGFLRQSLNDCLRKMNRHALTQTNPQRLRQQIPLKPLSLNPYCYSLATAVLNEDRK